MLFFVYLDLPSDAINLRVVEEFFMRVFVTGASGYIGNAVAKAFQMHGHHVYALVRNPEKAKNLKINEIQPVIGELKDIHQILPNLEDIDVYVHCAFEYSPKGVEQEGNVVDLLIKAGSDKRLRAVILTSGVWVYGNTRFQPATEAATLNAPQFRKWRQSIDEKAIEAANKNLRVIVIRPGCVYGGSGGLTGLWFDSGSEGVYMAGNGANHWAMVHIHDLARAYVMAAEKELSGYVFNIVDHSRFTVKEMAEAAAWVSGMEGRVQSLTDEEATHKYGAVTEGLLLDQQVSNERALRILGWNPRQPNFIDGIPRYYQAWKTAKT